MVLILIMLHFKKQAEIMNQMIRLDAKDKEWLADIIRKAINLGVRGIQFSERTRIPNLQRHMHPLYRIMSVVEGGYEYRICRNDEVRPVWLTPGNILFCSRYALTIGPPPAELKPVTMLTLVFFPQYIRFLVTVCGNGIEHYWYHTAAPMPQPGWNVLQSLNELAGKNAPVELSGRLAVFMYDYCLDQLLHDEEAANSKSLLTYHRIKTCMVENLHLPINREQVGRMLGLNPSHISKLFSRYDEQNFNASLKAMRMELALELVRENHFLIDEIAEQCGFVNTGYFIKSFRDFYGKTPGAFRNAR